MSASRVMRWVRGAQTGTWGQMIEHDPVTRLLGTQGGPGL
jgi:hypothetical protein